MASQQAIVFGVVLPIVISIFVMLIAWRPWLRSGAVFRGQWGGAVAVGAGYLVAHVGIHGWPSFDPAKAQHAAFWAALLGMVVGVASVSAKPRPIWRRIGRAVGAIVIVWLVMRWKMTLGQWTLAELALWVGIGALGALLFWALISILRESVEEVEEAPERSARTGFDTLFVLSGVAGLGSLLIGFNAHLVSGAQASGAMALGLLVCALVCLWRPGIGAMRSATPVVALCLPAIWIDAALRADLDFGYAMTLVCAPGVAFAAASVVPEGAHHLVRTAARVLGAVIPIGILVVIEVAKFVTEQAEAAALGY